MSLKPTPTAAQQYLQKRHATVEAGKLINVYYNQKACGACASRPLCTAGKEKRIRRWEHEAVLDEMERRLEAIPDAMAVRRCTVEHVFGTIKGWMGATHFRTRGLRNVGTEASLAILAYNIKRHRRRRRCRNPKSDNGVNDADACHDKITGALSGAEFSHSLGRVADRRLTTTPFQP